MKVLINEVPKNLIKWNQDRSIIFRKELKAKMLSVIKDNPDIGVNELHRMIGGSQSLIGTMFTQIRREIKRKKEVNSND